MLLSEKKPRSSNSPSLGSATPRSPQTKSQSAPSFPITAYAETHSHSNSSSSHAPRSATQHSPDSTDQSPQSVCS